MDIITVRLHGETDNSPLEMISAARLAYLKRVEAAAKVLAVALTSSSDHRDRPLTDLHVANYGQACDNPTEAAACAGQTENSNSASAE